MPVVNNTPFRVNDFRKNGVIYCQLFILPGYNLQVKKLCDNDQKCDKKDQADNTASRLVKHRHGSIQAVK
jgi:hypothetical protein